VSNGTEAMSFDVAQAADNDLTVRISGELDITTSTRSRRQSPPHSNATTGG
jgi:hypothetical protein